MFKTQMLKLPSASMNLVLLKKKKDKDDLPVFYEFPDLQNDKQIHLF